MVRTLRATRRNIPEMLWLLVVLLLVLWLGGFALNVAGGLIHALLVIALIVAIYNLFVTRGRTV
jgi:hypothetical protein